jgi:hypothetical protein
MKLQEYIKRIIKEELLIEALTLSKAKEMTSIKRNPSIQQQLDSIFKKLQSSTKTTASKRGDRIYIPFGTDTTITSTENFEITSFLKMIVEAYSNFDDIVKEYKSGSLNYSNFEKIKQTYEYSNIQRIKGDIENLAIKIQNTIDK